MFFVDVVPDLYLLLLDYCIILSFLLLYLLLLNLLAIKNENEIKIRFSLNAIVGG